MEKIYITKSFKQTQKIGEEFAKEILKLSNNKKAILLGLNGNLGGGKTTFLQGFAKGLGIKEKVLSPTFVILKRFIIPKINKNFYHIDCYRLQNHKDILDLDFKRIISDNNNIIALEWPEKVKRALPKEIFKIGFKFIDKNKREIKFIK